MKKKEVVNEQLLKLRYIVFRRIINDYFVIRRMGGWMPWKSVGKIRKDA